MAALSTDTPRTTATILGTQAQVVNADTAYSGGVAALCTTQHATSGSRGRTEPFSGAVGQLVAGLYSRATRLGDTSASPPVATSISIEDQRVEYLAVTGLAGTVADNFKLVYATTDNDFTLTRPAAPNGNPVGIVVQFRTATTCDIILYGLVTQLGIALGGGTLRSECIGVVAPVLTGSANLLTGWKAPCHGRILSVYAECIAANTDVDVDSDINLEIGGTNVTGGVVELIYTDAAGDKKSGTAVSAANVFHAGDAIDVEVTVNTAGTATDPGLYNLYVEFETLPGL
jgi:hypothetical protein